MIEYNQKEAVDFLKLWKPEGPWTLTAIVPDGKVTTQTLETVDRVINFLEAHAPIENVYFQVNSLIKPIFSKSTKEHILSMDWLWVDMDPRPGEKDLDAERERALRLLNEFELKPTCVIGSGTGIQAFWKLETDEELIINGDVRKATELEAYNIQLENLFGSDHCHNCDRIMRLPGTLNFQNKAKVKKYGARPPVIASLLQFKPDLIYKISQFTPAVQVQTPETTAMTGTGATVNVGGNIAPVDLDNLKSVTDYTKQIIVQGDDPDDPTKWGSRSEVVLYVICQLLRDSVTDEDIYSIITDKSFGISAHIYDQADPHKSALRNIRRAKEMVTSPELAELNSRHAVISNMGGKCRIIEEVWDGTLKRNVISKQSFEDFRNRYRNKKIQLNKKFIDLGTFWIEHPLRRQFNRIVFEPGVDSGENVYNLWRGFSVQNLPGKKHESFLDHILENLCNKDPRLYNYILNWMARTVQQPALPGETALVLRGKMGTGKSFFARTFGRLFGSHFLQVSDAKHLVGSFNSHLRDVLVVFGDEAFYAGDKKHEGVLKTLITEESITFEGKGENAEAGANYTHIILASNSQWVIPAGAEERRFLVIDVGDQHMQDSEYFRDIKKDLDNGGLENLLHFLITRDIKTFEVRDVPQTLALKEQKLLSMSLEDQWWLQKLEQGYILDHQDKWYQRIHCRALYEDYVNTLTKVRRSNIKTDAIFGKWFKKHVGYIRKTRSITKVPRRDQTDGMEYLAEIRDWCYHIEPLEFLRQDWDKRFKTTTDWADPNAEDGEEE